MCRYSELLPAVFRAEDCIETLSEKLQMFRDTEVRELMRQVKQARGGREGCDDVKMSLEGNE